MRDAMEKHKTTWHELAGCLCECGVICEALQQAEQIAGDI